MIKLCSNSHSVSESTNNLATGERNKYTIDFLTHLIEKEESEGNFMEVNRHAGELVSMSRHVESLCKHLDGTAFYASNYGSSLKRSAYDLYKMLKSENGGMNNSQISKEDEEILAKTDRDLKFLTLYAKIGESLDKSIRAITQKLKDWLADANRVIDFDSYIKAEERYVHYKNKITRLINQVEELGIAGKKISKRKKKRIERNIIKFQTQKQLMVVLCKGKLDEAKEYIDKADILGPAGLTLLKKAIVNSTNQAHRELGSLASSMNIKQINLMNSSNRRKKDRLTIGESNVRDDLMTSANSKQFQMENNVQGRMSVGKGLELFKKKSLKNEEEEEEEINISVKDLSLMGREIDQKLDESKKLDRLENSFGDELNESDVQVVDIEKTFKSENEEEEEKEEKMEEELEKKVIQSFVDSQQNIKKTESPQNQSQKKIILKKISSDEEEGKEIASKSEKSSEEDEEDDDGHPNPYKGQKKSEKHNPWEKALEEESLGTLDFGKGFSPNKDIVKEEQEEKGKSNFFDEKISPIDKKRKKQFFMKKGSVEDDNDSKKSFRKRDGSAFVVTGDHKFVDTPDKKIEVRKKKKRSRSARINSHAKNRRVGAAIKIVSNPVEILQKEEENKTEKEEDREVEDELNSHDITDWNPPEINELKRHTPTPGFDNFGKSSVIEIMNDFGQNENEEGTEFDKPDLRKQFSPTIDLYESMPVEDQVQNGEEEEVKGEDNEKDKFILEPDFERGFSFKDKKLIARDVEEMKKQPKSVIMENENEDNEPKSEKKLVDEKEGIEEEKQTVEEGEEKVKQAVEEEEEKQIEFEVENKEPLEEEENKEIPEKEKEISVENKWGEENEDDKDNNPFFNAFGKTKNEEKEAAFPELSVSLEKFADIETMKEVSPSSDFGNFDNFKQPFNQSTDMVKVDTDLVEEGDPFRDVFGKKSHENIVQSEEKKPFGFDEKDDDEEEEKEFESAIDNADSDIDTNFDQFNFKSNEERSPDAFNKKKNQEKIEEVIEENKPEEKEEEFNKEKESEEKEVENKGQVKENKEQEIVKTETPDNKEQEEPEPTPTDIKKIPIEPEQKKTQNPAKEIPIQPKPDKTFSKNPTQISSASELPSEYQATPTIKKREQFDLSLHKTTSLMEEARENQNRIIEESPEIIEEGSSSDIFKGFENKNESEIDWGNNFENKGDDEWGNGWGNENGDDYWNHKNQSVELEPLELSESNFGSNERNPFADI